MMDLIASAMVSSLGRDAHTACAAARAGLARPAELPFMALEDDSSPGLAVGHPIPLFGGGFEGDARLIRLLEGALRDLIAQIPADSLLIPNFGVYLAIPASDREHQGLDLILDEDERADYVEEFGEPAAVDEVSRAKTLITTAMKMAELPEGFTNSLNIVRVSVSGHAAVIELYDLAQHELESGLVDLAIVGGVDSLVGRTTLSWLQLTHRLKSAESPTGLSPGEAAALIVVGGPPMAARILHSPYACIDQITMASSPTSFFSGEPSHGSGQFEIMRRLADIAGASGEAPWFIVDQNGEVYRANDWGHALVRRRASSLGDTTDPIVWYPAASFGDTGAATGAVATCIAARALERGYAPGTYAMVLTNSDGPERAGCLLSGKEN